jgi:hypothetical protein
VRVQGEAPSPRSRQAEVDIRITRNVLKLECAMARFRTGRLRGEKATPALDRASRIRKSRRKFLVPAAEWLEARRLLTSYQWDGGSSGDFDVAANWVDANNNHAVPGASDDISISGGATVIVTGTAAVNTITADSHETIDVTGGTFTVNNASAASSTLGTLNVSSGATFEVGGGTMALTAPGTDSGTFNVATGAQLQFSTDTSVNDPYVIAAGARFTGDGDYELDYEFSYVEVEADLSIVNFSESAGEIDGTGTITVNGAFDWTGGTFSGSGTLDIPALATLSIDSANTVFFNGWTLDNAGTTTWSGSSTIDGSGTVNNESGGTLTIDASGDLLSDGNGPLNNAGTINVNNWTGTALVYSTPFDNTGTVNVETGSLAILSNGTDSGTFNVATDAQLQFSGDVSVNDPYVIAAGARFTGDGDYEIDAEFSYVAVEANLSIVNFSESAGEIDGTGAITITGAYDWSGGAFSGSGTLNIPSAATLSIDGSATSAYAFDGWTLDNAGNTTWSGTTSTFYGSGTINNESGGTLTLDAGGELLPGNGELNNAGTMNINTGSATASIYGAVFNNTGTVTIETGALAIIFGGTDSGTFNVAAGAQLQFSGDIDTSAP